MTGPNKVTADHLSRSVYLYVRQSTLRQVHENRESTARQYALRRRAEELGWKPHQITVIDEDLGLSGASMLQRSGFQRLVADVGLGKAGMVMGLEVSRLARNSTDWHRLLEICALADTLILDEDGLYDPSHFNDRLLLGLKGTMSEAELHVLRARLLGGKLNKARRGELWMRPIVGFAYDAEKRLVLDPDAQIQGVIRLLFDTYRRVGTAFGVARHFNTNGIQWPHRMWEGVRSGELTWGRLTHHRVLDVLRNPRYTGAYIYGRVRTRKIPATGNEHRRILPREEWKVFIPNANQGYISWEEYEATQIKLRANACTPGWDGQPRPPREGSALLQGLVLCGRCGDRMTVYYHSKGGARSARYVCNRGVELAQSGCQNIPAAAIDEAIGEMVVKSVTPEALKVAVEVFEELRARRSEVDRLHKAQVDRARYEAELAQHQYMLVRPENRLVADTLEKRWNEKLSELAKAEQEFIRASEGKEAKLGAEAFDRVQALASDFPRVWNDPQTPSREKKRMLRLMVEDVTLTRDEMIRIQVRWKGGAATTLEISLPSSRSFKYETPAELVEQIQKAAPQHTDEQIAQMLNGLSLRSGHGKAITRSIVWCVRQAHKIPSYTEYLRRAGWIGTKEMAEKLKVYPHTAQRFAREGVLRAVKADDAGKYLFAPIEGPLPTAQPGKPLKDRRRFPESSCSIEREVQYG